MMILFNFTPYTEKEKARAILFDNQPADAFQFVFVFDGIKYYKKVK